MSSARVFEIVAWTASSVFLARLLFDAFRRRQVTPSGDKYRDVCAVLVGTAIRLDHLVSVQPGTRAHTRLGALRNDRGRTSVDRTGWLHHVLRLSSRADRLDCSKGQLAGCRIPGAKVPARLPADGAHHAVARERG